MSKSGYSQSPRLLKGAIIQFSAPMLVPIPNIIVFQYNPENLSRTLTPWAPMERERVYDEQGRWSAKALEKNEANANKVNALAQPYDPAETFSVVLELDAADALEEPESHPVAFLSGVADRIAALEMLCYPPGESALGGLLASVSVSIGSGGISASAGAEIKAAQRKSVPVVLFFWGPGRIVPVRITSLAVEEQAFNPLLYPIRAKVSVGLRVLTPEDLVNIEGEKPDEAMTATVEIAKACYKFTRAQKEVLATANLANSAESIMGMLPF